MRRQSRDATFGAASRVVLVLSLSLAMNAWPYDRACGVGLFAYLAAAGAIVAGAIWAAVGAWGGRAPRLHTVAMVAALWGLVLIAAQVLPRVDYARVDPGNRPTWRCWKPGQASVGVPVVNGLFRRGG
jgi:acetyl-CoA acetyltransferase